MPTAPPQLTINGVPVNFRIEDDGGDVIVEKIPGTEPPSASVIFTCDWDQRFQLARGLAGAVSGRIGSIARTPPFAYPDIPQLRCVSIDEMRMIAPTVRLADGWPTAKRCQLTATFGVFPWGFDSSDPASQNDPSGQPWTTTKFKVSAEVIQPKSGTYAWTAGPDSGKPVPDAELGVMRPRVEISMTRHWMPVVPLLATLTYIGTTNIDPVTIGDTTFVKGSLLLAGVNTEVATDTLGNRTQEVEYVLLGQAIDFNKLLGSDGLFYLVNSKPDGSGNYPFPYSSFWTNLP
jgi:hypothetical protein